MFIWKELSNIGLSNFRKDPKRDGGWGWGLKIYFLLGRLKDRRNILEKSSEADLKKFEKH